MSIRILSHKCIRCGSCLAVCPGSLLRQSIEGKAEIPHPERCWSCASCLKECPVQAIALFLGEDMGGLGGQLTVRKENTLLHWTVLKPDGTVQTITVDSQNANQY